MNDDMCVYIGFSLCLHSKRKKKKWNRIDENVFMITLIPCEIHSIVCANFLPFCLLRHTNVFSYIVVWWIKFHESFCNRKDICYHFFLSFFFLFFFEPPSLSTMWGGKAWKETTFLSQTNDDDEWKQMWYESKDRRRDTMLFVYKSSMSKCFLLNSHNINDCFYFNFSTKNEMKNDMKETK